MTDEQTMPKRRGRPPGSKNKPKTGAIAKPRATRRPKAVSAVEATTRAQLDALPPGDWTPEPQTFTDLTPPLIGSFSEITVVVQFGGGLSKQTDDHEMSWPAGWPLPRQGDAIMVSATQGGRVMSTNFRLDLQKIYILAN